MLVYHFEDVLNIAIAAKRFLFLLLAGPRKPISDGGATAGSFTLCTQSDYTLHDLINRHAFIKSIKTRDDPYTHALFAVPVDLVEHTL